MFARSTFSLPLFLALFLLLQSRCGTNTAPAGFAAEIRHQIHNPSPNDVFRQADSLAYQQDYPHAAAAFRQILTQNLNAPERTYCLNRLADLDLRLYRDSSAQGWLGQIETLHPGLQGMTAVEKGDYWFNRGRVAYRAFRPQEALHFLHLSLGTFQQVYGQRHRCVAEAMDELGMVHFEFTRKSDSATVYVEAARAIFLSTPALQKLRRENELATGLIRLTNRDHEIGQAYAEVALALGQEAPWFDTIFYARALCLLGNMLKKQGRRGEADGYFQEAVALTAGMQQVRRQEFYRDWIVNLMRRDTQGQAAFEARMAALQVLLAEQKTDRYANPDRLRGYCHYRHQEYRAAVDIYRTFLPRTDSLTNPLLLEEAGYVLADSYLKLAEQEKKPRLLDSVLYFVRYSFLFGTPNAGKLPPLDSLLCPQYFRHVDNPSVYLDFQARAWLAKYQKSHQPADAWHALEVFALADSLLLPGVKAMAEGALLTFQIDVGDETYAQGLATALACLRHSPGAQRPLDLAFRFCERMKSYVLFRDLGSRERDSIGVLKKEIRTLLQSRRQTPDAAMRLTAAAERYESILHRYQLQSEDFRSKNVLQVPPTVREVQASLGENQAFITYSLNREHLYALLVCRDTAVLVQKNAFGLRPLLNTFLSCLKTSADSFSIREKTFRDTAWQLYRDLLGDFEPFLLGKKELVIAPDRELHRIPFEALLTAAPGQTAAADYLLMRYEVAYAPSWKIWARNRARETLPDQPRVMVFGNTSPEFKLPYTADEVAGIQKRLGVRNVKIMLDAACTKKNFLRRCTDARYDILHLSLHASSDPDDRSNHQVRFGLRDTMYGFELGDCRITARLVVLSACKTASGNDVTGEGAYSLSRTFLEAGACQVVATLWEVDNGQNAQLMDFFYQEIKKGEAPRRALHLAKLKQMKLSGVGAWAGVVWVG